MPQENGNPRITVEKILKLERSTGFRDAAVTCGIEAFIERQLPSACSLVAGYAEASHFDRQRMIARLVDHLEGPPSAPSEAEITAPVAGLRGVGAKRGALLEKLGVTTVEDLLYYLPRRLEDRTRFASIGTLKPEDEAVVRGKILAVDQHRAGRGMTVVKAAIGDGTGFLYAVWFNQPWIAQQLRRGEEVDVFGRAEWKFREWQMASPTWEPAGAGREIGRLVPIYPATEGLTDRFVRALVERNLDAYLPAVRDVVPGDVRAAQDLPGPREAIASIHRPAGREAFERARRALAFEELFLLQVGLLSTTRDRAGVAHAGSGQLVNSLLASLPFPLTVAQQRALREIRHDLSEPVRMMRLLQGDVGSGKTLVAVAAALCAVEAGYQVALMAPTEILAEQHAANLDRLLAGLPVRVGLLTGTTSGDVDLRRSVEEELDLVVGTHALIQESVTFRRLGLVVIDEQHRFGVVQRSLIEEKGERVDLLVMSATPIPRTIALTLFGEFDISILDELPMGEKQTRTHWVAEARREAVYEEVGKALEDGRRGYVILPLVEESEKIDAKAAVKVYEELSERFSRARVGLLHGRLPAGEKAEVMTRFRGGDVHLLVSTTVVEVGVDILDADFMVIEHADRFGLSQLHQLRGRIGRSGQPSICFAIADARTDEARRRLEAFRDVADGFAIAEEDLRIRGPGDLLGTHQHGFLTRFRAVDLVADVSLMEAAQAAARVVHRRGVEPDTAAAAERRFGEVIRWLRV
ncbi:MAG: ATP-dependent DNA helicase RecG [Candidatus Bipolaricaulis sp.]|nr:ATP-dependent DNA helicase RecG [Candidatus Bipolaricaulis sp.]